MNYLQKVTQETKTRFWVNNPTLADCEAVLRAGADRLGLSATGAVLAELGETA